MGENTSRDTYWNILQLNNIAGESSRVDALTITASLGSQADRLKARAFISELALTLATEYYPTSAVNFNRIGVARGWKRGSVAYGSTKDWNVCAITGERTEDALKMVLDYDGAVRCTRVDFALDLIVAKPLQLATEVYERYPKDKSKLRLIRSASGDTLYINQRNSANFGRLYDKSKAYEFREGSGNVWRFEVEYKQAKAARLLEGIKKHGSDFVKQVVIKQFRQWDIPLPLIPECYDIPKLELQLDCLDNRLDWLRRCAPTIRAMVSESAKAEDEIRLMLNLPMFT